MAQASGFLPPTRKARMDLPDLLGWPSHNCCRHLGSELVSFSVSIYISLSFKNESINIILRMSCSLVILSFTEIIVLYKSII